MFEYTYYNTINGADAVKNGTLMTVGNQKGKKTLSNREILIQFINKYKNSKKYFDLVDTAKVLTRDNKNRTASLELKKRVKVDNRDTENLREYNPYELKSLEKIKRIISKKK